MVKFHMMPVIDALRAAEVLKEIYRKVVAAGELGLQLEIERICREKGIDPEKLRNR